MNGILEEMIIKQLGEINNGIMLLLMQEIYKEAFEQGIISKPTYKKYLCDSVKYFNEFIERLTKNENE